MKSWISKSHGPDSSEIGAHSAFPAPARGSARQMFEAREMCACGCLSLPIRLSYFLASLRPLRLLLGHAFLEGSAGPGVHTSWHFERQRGEAADLASLNSECCALSCFSGSINCGESHSFAGGHQLFPEEVQNSCINLKGRKGNKRNQEKYGKAQLIARRKAKGGA